MNVQNQLKMINQRYKGANDVIFEVNFKELLWQYE